MKCSHCEYINANDAKFCSQCGHEIDPQGSASASPRGQSVRDEIREILRDEYASRDVVEMRLSEAIVSRVLGWAKTAGIVVGIPIAAAFAVVGISTIPTAIEIRNFLNGEEGKIKSMDIRFADTETRFNGVTSKFGRLAEREEHLSRMVDQQEAALAQAQDLVNRSRSFAARLDGLSAGLVRANDLAGGQSPSQRLPLGQGRIVFIQYMDNVSKAAMTNLQSDLASQQFVTPGIQAVRHDPDGNAVKYFRPEDAEVAAAIAKIVDASLARSCQNKPRIATLVPLRAAHPSPTTQLEVWINSPCVPIAAGG